MTPVRPAFAAGWYPYHDLYNGVVRWHFWDGPRSWLLCGSRLLNRFHDPLTWDTATYCSACQAVLVELSQEHQGWAP